MRSTISPVLLRTAREVFVPLQIGDLRVRSALRAVPEAGSVPAPSARAMSRAEVRQLDGSGLAVTLRTSRDNSCHGSMRGPILDTLRRVEIPLEGKRLFDVGVA